tara:strand:- start:193 stop:774 length:582 start_codon:yes stop_codon:yes gene_type:complete
MDTSDFIIRYRGAFSKEQCEEIIKNIEHFENNKLLFHDKSRLHREDHKSICLDNSFDVDLIATQKVSQLILPNYKPCIEEYINRFSLLSTNKFLVYSVKLKKIEAGAGFHAWHYENGSILNSTRAFVIQTYLNDDFDGGETEFLYQNRREEAVAGDVIIFPAAYTHVHRGNPPIGGTKYIATSWAVTQDSDGL